MAPWPTDQVETVAILAPAIPGLNVDSDSVNLIGNVSYVALTYGFSFLIPRCRDGLHDDQSLLKFIS